MRALGKESQLFRLNSKPTEAQRLTHAHNCAATTRHVCASSGCVLLVPSVPEYSQVGLRAVR